MEILAKIVEYEKALPQGRKVVDAESMVDFSELEKVLPPIVFRNWYRWRDVLPIAPRTVANDDSLGKGPKEKMMCGRVCGYPKAAFLDYLRAKSRVIKGGEAHE